MPDNSSIAELPIREAEKAEGHRELTFRRAAHSAFMWPVEAADLVKAGHPLTDLSGIGPSLARRILQWFDSPPKSRTSAQPARIPHPGSSTKDPGEESEVADAAQGRPADTHRMERWERGQLNYGGLESHIMKAASASGTTVRACAQRRALISAPGLSRRPLE